jgi:ribosome-binding factor A
MKQNANSRRMAAQAREKLGYILLFEVADPALEFVTLTGCEVSLDKSYLRAYVTCDRDSYEEVGEALARAKGRIRSLLGHALGWRVTPELVFEIDTTTDEAERIGEALKDVPPTLSVEKDEFGYPIEATDDDSEDVGHVGDDEEQGADGDGAV